MKARGAAIQGGLGFAASANPGLAACPIAQKSGNSSNSVKP